MGRIRQRGLEPRGDAVGRDHVEPHAGADHDARLARAVVQGARGLEHADFAGDVEVVGLRREAGLQHRRRGGGERPGAMQDEPHAFEPAFHGSGVVEREHAVVEPQFLRERREPSALRPARDRAQAAHGRFARDEFAGIAIRAIEQPLHVHFPALRSINTSTAPVPPCAGGGEWNASTSARCRSTRSTRFFSTGNRSPELRPAVDDAHAAHAVRAAVAQELAQQRFGFARRQAVQVQFLLRRVFAAGEAPEHLRRHVVAPMAERVAGLQRGSGHAPQFLARLVVVASRHPGRGLGLGAAGGAGVAAARAPCRGPRRSPCGTVRRRRDRPVLAGACASPQVSAAGKPPAASVIMARMQNVPMP